MDQETKEMFHLVLDKLGRIDTRLGRLEAKVDNLETKVDSLETKVDNLEIKVDKLETRVGSLENEFKEFKLEMKQEHKITDGKIGMIYNKLTSDIEEIKNKPEPKFKIVREL